MVCWFPSLWQNEKIKSLTYDSRRRGDSTFWEPLVHCERNSSCVCYIIFGHASFVPRETCGFKRSCVFCQSQHQDHPVGRSSDTRVRLVSLSHWSKFQCLDTNHHFCLCAGCRMRILYLKAGRSVTQEKACATLWITTLAPQRSVTQGLASPLCECTCTVCTAALIGKGLVLFSPLVFKKINK